MILVLLITAASVIFAANGEFAARVKDEPKPAESAPILDDHYPPVKVLQLIRQREQGYKADRLHQLSGQNHYEGWRGRTQEVHDLPEPIILHTPNPLRHQGYPNYEPKRKSPEYIQPTWELDYRYLKTGGKDGDQILNPKEIHNNEHKKYTEYNAYLEHLRLTHLAEVELHKRRHGENHNRGNWQPDRGQPLDYDHGHGHGQTSWYKYG